MQKNKIGGVMPKTESIKTIKRIIEAVSERWDIESKELLGRNRSQPHAFARQVCMALSYHKTGFSLAQVGECYGNRDHGTVIHAIKVVENALNEKAIAKIIAEIVEEI